MRVRQDSSLAYAFGYLDESATACRYFGCGMLVLGPNVSGKQEEALNRKIRELKPDFGLMPRGDVGWKKVPTREGKYLQFYVRLVEGFFRCPSLRFSALIVDTSKYPLDSRSHFSGSRDAGIDGFAFHLVRCRLFRRLQLPNDVVVRIDQRSRPSRQSVRRLAERLQSCTEVSDEDSMVDTVAVRQIQGGRHPLIHLTDILLGAVTAGFNCKPSSFGRRTIYDRLTAELGRTPETPTPPGEDKFNVWLFKPAVVARAAP